MRDPDDEAGARRRRWTRLEYQRLADDGYFRPDEKLELLAGDIYPKHPPACLQAAAIDAAQAALQAAAGPGYRVRAQLPLALGEHAAPLPSLAMVPGCPWDYAQDHPQTALLVVEVVMTGHDGECRRKAALYAQFGIADFWIVHPDEERIDVCREPFVERGAWGYQQVTSWRHGDVLAPLAVPTAAVTVSDLLPPR